MEAQLCTCKLVEIIGMPSPSKPIPEEVELCRFTARTPGFPPGLAIRYKDKFYSVIGGRMDIAENEEAVIIVAVKPASTIAPANEAVLSRLAAAANGGKPLNG